MAHRAMSVLLRICEAIDRLFIAEVGPSGKKLIEEARRAWLATGNKNRPADARQYVLLLARHIRDGERREEFVEEANARIRL